jgi:transcriptional regulator with XRE-family HTH domain
MNYDEFIARVLKDSSVNSVAKRLGIPQKSLDRYTKAEQLPGWRAAKLMANEAGISLEEVFEMLAEEEQQKRLHPKDEVVERRRIELPTFALRTRRSPS